MASLIVSLLFLVGCFLLGHSATPFTTSPSPINGPLKIVATPKEVYLGLSKHQTVRCEVQSPGNHGYDRLVSLVLSKLNKATGKLEELISVSAFSDSITVHKPTTGSLTSDLNATGDSTLGIYWLYPAESDTGHYDCEATMLNSAATHTVKLNVSAIVEHKVPSLPALVDHFRLMEIELDSLKERVNKATDSMFYRSQPANGLVYHLAKYPYGNVDRAEAACRLVDSYLVEIANASQFEDVKAFLNSPNVTLPATGDVLVGVSDEVTEGTFVYRSTGASLTLAPWYTGEPNSGATYDCVVLKASSAVYYDYLCSSALDASFLCQKAV